MSKVLKFANGESREFVDTSTILDCVIVLSNYGEVDAIRDQFTEDNLKGAVFDGELVEQIIPVKSTAEADADGNVSVHFINREKTDMEIIKEEIIELQEAAVEG